MTERVMNYESLLTLFLNVIYVIVTLHHLIFTNGFVYPAHNILKHLAIGSQHNTVVNIWTTTINVL